jgi:transcriptional regulator with XRE-family HTH domain
MDRSTIARLENGDRGVTLDDVFHLAVALDVSPMRLMTPDKPSHPIVVAPALDPVLAGHVRRWVNGDQPLEESDDRFFFKEIPEERELMRRNAGIAQIQLLLQDIYDCMVDPENPDPELLTQLLGYLGQQVQQWGDLVNRQYAETMKRSKGLGT